MTATISTVNQGVQIGIETVPGTTVPANKILPATSIEPSIKFAAKDFRPQGRKYASLVVPGKEYMEAKLSGLASYTELVYWLSSAIDTVTPTLHATGTESQDWTFTPVLAGNANPKTFTVEFGDATRAAKFGYGLVTDYGLKFSRDSIDFSGTLIGQAMADNITLTGTPTRITEQPILPVHVNHYLDTTAAQIGQTAAGDVLEADFGVSGIYGQYWPMARSNNSFAQHVDLAPKASFKVSMMKDAIGMSPLVQARTGDTLYWRVDATGPIIETTIPNNLQLDMAVKVMSVSGFSDSNGVYKVEWEFSIVDDSALAKAYSILLTNTLTTL